MESRLQADARMFVLIVLACALVAGGAVYWLALGWLPGFSGWPLFWRAAVLGLMAMNIGIAGAGVAAVVVVAAVAGVVPGVVPGAGAFLILGPGIFFGVFLRAILTRIAATLWHFRDGLPRFAANWSNLVTATDFRTEPELVPDLPKDSSFRIRATVKGFRSDGAADRIFTILAVFILFAPAWLFRLTLKSTFLLYWPLLFVATAPSAYKSDDGHLIWDDAWGRRVIDWIAVLLATGALIAISSTIYDPSFFASFVAWADPRDLPAHVLLQAISFKVWELDLWEWFALMASTITVILFLWSNAINIRHRGRDRQPGWAVLKTVYALGRVQKLLVAATILTSLFAMLWFVHDTCTLPDGLTDLLATFLGPPQACVTN